VIFYGESILDIFASFVLDKFVILFRYINLQGEAIKTLKNALTVDFGINSTYEHSTVPLSKFIKALARFLPSSRPLLAHFLPASRPEFLNCYSRCSIVNSIVSSVGFADYDVIALMGHSSVLLTACPINKNLPHTCWMNFLPCSSNNDDVDGGVAYHFLSEIVSCAACAAMTYHMKI
jgi:hypothetical protein